MHETETYLNLKAEFGQNKQLTTSTVLTEGRPAILEAGNINHPGDGTKNTLLFFGTTNYRKKAFVVEMT